MSDNLKDAILLGLITLMGFVAIMWSFGGDIW